MTPISFPYRDMEMIWESHLLHNAKKQEFIHNYFVSVLTHNFSVWKPVIERLEVKKMVGCREIEGR